MNKYKLLQELKNDEERDAFVSELINETIPFQIRALREQRGWHQKELAERAGMLQAAISRAENPNYAKFNLETLKRLASAFKVGLLVRFAPLIDLVEWESNLSPDSLKVSSFDEYVTLNEIDDIPQEQHKEQKKELELIGHSAGKSYWLSDNRIVSKQEAGAPDKPIINKVEPVVQWGVRSKENNSQLVMGV